MTTDTSSSSIKLSSSSYTQSRWLNGLGSTTQFYILPSTSTISDFNIRISSANLDESCYFSRFINYKRILIIIKGKEIYLYTALNKEIIEKCIEQNIFDRERWNQLKDQSDKCKILVPYEIYHFSGNDIAYCDITDKEKRLDYNIIYNDNYIVQVDILKVTNNNTNLIVDNNWNYHIFNPSEDNCEINYLDHNNIIKLESLNNWESLIIEKQINNEINNINLKTNLMGNIIITKFKYK